MKKRKKFNIKKLLLIIIILIGIIYFKNFYKSNSFISEKNSNNYDIIKLDKNENYKGIGQKTVDGKDGYFTTFTTVDVNQKTYKEYKQNGSSSWASHRYWGGTMEENGCGITAISIILSGYNKNYSPEKLRKKYYPVLNNDKISKELSDTFGIKNTNFYYDSSHLSKDTFVKHLKTNRPILICVWNKPNNNRWTTASHYMALLATDENLVYVSNPNGLENSSKSSGWYSFDEVLPWVAKALFVENN